jgi:hypothetical protein
MGKRGLRARREGALPILLTHSFRRTLFMTSLLTRYHVLEQLKAQWVWYTRPWIHTPVGMSR